MSVQFQLKLFANLAQYLPAEGEHIDIEPGASIGEILDAIGLPKEKAKLIFVNGIKGSLETPLQGGERVGIFPPVAGG